MAAPLLVAWLSLWAGPSPVVDAGVVDAGVVEVAGAVAEASRGLAPNEPDLPRAESPDLGGPDLDLGWTLVRTMVALGMVVALVYLTLNVGLRKLLGIRATPTARIVTVLERVVLDQKRALFVVEAAGEVFLLGGADTSLTLLSKLDPLEVTRLRGAASATPVPLKLSPLLQKLLGRNDDRPPPTT